MAASISDKLRKLVFDRVLGIERHEYAAVAWSFAYFFCVLSSYYMLRPVRETMAVGSGPDTIPFLFIGTFVAMLVATPIFGWVASRYPRRVFLPWVYLFFVYNILIFWLVYWIALDRQQDYVWLGRAFFVWLSVFNLYVVSVFWSFMADIYTREEGRRLFGVIASGGSIGALLGGAATSALVVTIGFHNLLPIAAALLLVALLCITKLRKWVITEHEDEVGDTVESEKPLGGNPFAGITHAFSVKYFVGIVVVSIIASLLGTALYMFMAELVELQIPSPDEQTKFFSDINVATNALTLIGQMFVVRHVVKRFGIGRALAVMPVFSIVGFILLALDPVLAVVAILTVARRALGFAFGKTGSDMLYSVVTPEEKYKTKNFIDTTVYRGGDVIGTWAIKLMPVIGIVGIGAISVIMVPFAVLWAIVALWLGREYKRRARELRDSGIV